MVSRLLPQGVGVAPEARSCQLIIRADPGRSEFSLRAGLSNIQLLCSIDGHEVGQRWAALPGNEVLAVQAETWEENYGAAYDHLDRLRGIRPNLSIKYATQWRFHTFTDECNAYVESLRCWLDSPEFAQPLAELIAVMQHETDSNDPDFDVILETQSKILLGLPWEFAWSDLLGTGTRLRAFCHTPTVNFPQKRPNFWQRYLQNKDTIPTQELAQIRPRILVILGADNDLQTHQDWKNIQETFGGDADVELFLPNKFQGQVKKALADCLRYGHQQSGPWSIIVFAGHGDAGGGLSLSRDEVVSSDDLREVLKPAIENGLGLLVLAACHGVAFGLNAIGDGVALPWTVAMQSKIEDQACIFLLDQLLKAYRDRHYPIHKALAYATSALRNQQAQFPGAWLIPKLVAAPQMPRLDWADLQGALWLRQNRQDQDLAATEPASSPEISTEPDPNPVPLAPGQPVSNWSHWWAKRYQVSGFVASGVVGVVGCWAIAGPPLAYQIAPLAKATYDKGQPVLAQNLYNLQVLLGWFEPFISSEGLVSSGDIDLTQNHQEAAKQKYQVACREKSNHLACSNWFEIEPDFARKSEAVSLLVKLEAEYFAKKAPAGEKPSYKDRQMQVVVRLNRANLNIAVGQAELARPDLDEAEALSRRYGIPSPRLGCEWARYWALRGDTVRARQVWSQTKPALAAKMREVPEFRGMEVYDRCLRDADQALKSTPLTISSAIQR